MKNKFLILLCIIAVLSGFTNACSKQKSTSSKIASSVVYHNYRQEYGIKVIDILFEKDETEVLFKVYKRRSAQDAAVELYGFISTQIDCVRTAIIHEGDTLQQYGCMKKNLGSAPRRGDKSQEMNFSCNFVPVPIENRHNLIIQIWGFPEISTFIEEEGESITSELQIPATAEEKGEPKAALFDKVKKTLQIILIIVGISIVFGSALGIGLYLKLQSKNRLDRRRLSKERDKVYKQLVDCQTMMTQRIETEGNLFNQLKASKQEVGKLKQEVHKQKSISVKLEEEKNYYMMIHRKLLEEYERESASYAETKQKDKAKAKANEEQLWEVIQEARRQSDVQAGKLEKTRQEASRLKEALDELKGKYNIQQKELDKFKKIANLEMRYEKEFRAFTLKVLRENALKGV